MFLYNPIYYRQAKQLKAHICRNCFFQILQYMAVDKIHAFHSGKSSTSYRNQGSRIPRNKGPYKVPDRMKP